MEKRGITLEDLDAAICGDAPEIIENYPADERGAACLVLGMIDLARPLHALVGYGEDPDGYIDILNVYEPDADKWYDYRKRRR